MLASGVGHIHRWRASWSLLLIVLLSSGGLRAQTLRELPNGLSIWYEQDTTAHLMHLSLTIEGGIRANWAEFAGAGQLHEILFSEESDSTEGGATFQRSSAQRGWTYQHAFGTESSFFCISHFPKDLELVCQWLQHLVEDEAPLEEPALAAARTAVAARIQLSENDLPNQARRQAGEALWQSKWPRLDLPGSYTPVLRASLESVRRYHQNWVTPDGSLIAATGPMPADSFFTVAETYFAYLFAEGKKRVPPPLSPPRLRQDSIDIQYNSRAEQPLLIMEWALPGYAEGHYLSSAAPVFATWAGLRQHPLQDILVGSGRARGYFWNLRPASDAMQVSLYILPELDSLASCVAQVDSFLAHPEVSPKSLKAAHRMYRLQHGLTADSRPGRLRQIGERWAMQAPVWQQMAAPPEAEAMAGICGLLAASPRAMVLQLKSDALAEADALAAMGGPPETIEVPDSALADTIPVPVIDAERLQSFRIYFESSAFIPTDTSMSLIREAAGMLFNFPEQKIYLNGYADGQGDGVYNYQLSIQRARSVQDIMVNQFGIERERLVVRGFGEAFPEYPDDTEKHRALNRRVSFEPAPADAEENNGIY